MCNARFSTTCGSADQDSVEQYVACLKAVAACVPAQQALYDEAINDCLDTFQEGRASGECIELVVGD